MRHALATALAVLTAEGARGVLERAVDRGREARHRASFTRVPLERLDPPAPVTVLNVLPFPAAARYGGAALQLAARLEIERRGRPVALLALDGRRWRLEVEADGTRRCATGDLDRPLAPRNARHPELERLLERAADAVGARFVHLENLHQMPLPGLAELGARRRLVLSTHDFALYCPRVQLLDAATGRFCDYCRDAPRCTRCLAASAELAGIDVGERRAAAERLLSEAEAVVHPSEFMRRAHRELFPAVVPRRAAVIAPALEITPPARGRVPASPPRRVAFFGQLSERKGLADFVRAVETLAAQAPGVEWLALGGGEPAELARLRGAGIGILGSYRAGSGASRLIEHGIDLAVLPSRFPEAHCLALDECLVAGVPVVAADVGALGERVRALGAGATYGPAAGALEAALHAALGAPSPRTPPWDAPGALAAAASAHHALYEELAGGAPPPP